MVEELEKAGLAVVGKDPTGKRIEIIEIRDHPYKDRSFDHSVPSLKMHGCLPRRMVSRLFS
jgi:CTP synthase (UTP-ammonia lyase)